MIIGVWTPELVALVYAIPVVVPGSQPDCGNAEIFQVGQVVDHPSKIATVIGARILPVIRLSWRICWRFVGRTATRKTIDHYEIDHVCVCDSLKMCLRVEWGFNAKRNQTATLCVLDHEGILPGTRRGVDGDIYKKVCTRLINENIRDLNDWICGTHSSSWEI